jgi:hypothetical protein
MQCNAKHGNLGAGAQNSSQTRRKTEPPFSVCSGVGLSRPLYATKNAKNASFQDSTSISLRECPLVTAEALVFLLKAPQAVVEIVFLISMGAPDYGPLRIHRIPQTYFLHPHTGPKALHADRESR